MLADYGERYGLEVWAYCLMTNHVHFIAVPQTPDALGRTFRDTHQAYASWLNRKTRQSGHLWQGRFYSTPLDEPHLWTAVRYVERNPVRAGLAQRAEDWPWSSAAAHCNMRTDDLLSAIQMPWPVPDWPAYLRDEDEQEVASLRSRMRTGRPCGSDSFVQRLESLLGRILQPPKNRARSPNRSQRKHSCGICPPISNGRRKK